MAQHKWSEEGSPLPEKLIQDILAGQCIAFVGAGFSASAYPDWPTLLKDLANRSPKKDGAQVGRILKTLSNTREYETIGQLIKDSFDSEEDWGAAIRDVFETYTPKEQLDKRLERLRGIPFKAVLTTNFDPALKGGPGSPELYRRVLRSERPWWERSSWEQKSGDEENLVLKLHGDAERSVDNPPVMARSDYRRLLYEDQRYSNFLRAAFATHTILFLGVSFSDAYLNELRSEVLSFIGSPRALEQNNKSEEERGVWAYAMVPDRSPEWCDYLSDYEGIHALRFQSQSAQGDEEWEGFDQWLKKIHRATSTVARIRTLLKKSPVVWVDEQGHNNEYGVKILKQAKSNVVQLDSHQHLSPTEHGNAALIITRYGYDPDNPDQPEARKVLEEVRTWDEAPPVVIFAQKTEYVPENRRRMIRFGAWEYATSWQELFQVIQTLYGRR